MDLFNATPTEPKPLPLNKKISDLRRRFGYTQEQFAAKLGIKRSLLGAYEEGRAEPSMDTLIKIRVMYRLPSVESLFTNEKPVPATTEADMMYRKYIGLKNEDRIKVDQILNNS